MRQKSAPRVFKADWFRKAAKKAGIADSELCEAAREVMAGQADDLGGGVFKKRLNRNMHRSIVLGRGSRIWVYVYLFAKKDRENIEDDELKEFRALAKHYAVLTDLQLARLVSGKDLWEICNGDQTQVQE